MPTIESPRPLFPVLEALKSCDKNEYPSLFSYLENGEDWWQEHWLWGKEFLLYTGRNKSEHTYTRFRNEVERFLLWLYEIKKTPLDRLKKSDILDYADFCWHPPITWICDANHEKFVYRNGVYDANNKWAPFRLSLPKSQEAAQKLDKKRYKPSQQTLTATFTAVIAFYKYLMNEELCYGNPAQIAKKDCKYFIKDAQVKEIRRLSADQWQYVLDVVQELANKDDKYERSLFVIAALKTLFLRISELSERPQWTPIMSHFWEDEDGNWWLKVFGKGRKLRDTTVPPIFLEYLKRYRSYRGLSPLPYSGDTSPIVEKLRGYGGMSARHLSRLVQEIFDHAHEKMKHKEGVDKARKLKEASTHWLRHTGASMEVERGRALKDLSEDLGHSSMATTDTVYVQTENKKRAESGKGRKVE